MHELGNNIRRLRIAKGLSQNQLAKLLHTTNSTVSKWESGKMLPDIYIIREMTVLFSVNIEEIVGIECDNNKNSKNLIILLFIFMFLLFQFKAAIYMLLLLVIFIFTH